MNILIAPLNWGLGHATRCATLIRRYLNEGHQVVIAGDGDSLTWLKREFPSLRSLTLPHLHLHYGRGKSQVCAMLRALPQLIRWAILDHVALRDILAIEHFDLVISDNRFGFYPSSSFVRSHAQAIRSVYITHQVHIRLPRSWRWLDDMATRAHAWVINRYDQLWIPDYAQYPSLAGELSHGFHPNRIAAKVSYIGPLSRFSPSEDNQPAMPPYTVAVLSGLEPQRTLLEQQLLERFRQSDELFVLVQGLVGKPNTVIHSGNITIHPWMNDCDLQATLSHATHIIARSGYTTIMDLTALGLMSRAEFYPTPGQPEQEYLSCLHS